MRVSLGVRDITILSVHSVTLKYKTEIRILSEQCITLKHSKEMTGDHYCCILHDSNYITPQTKTVRYSKTCVKRPLKYRKNKDLNGKW